MSLQPWQGRESNNGSGYAGAGTLLSGRAVGNLPWIRKRWKELGEGKRGGGPGDSGWGARVIMYNCLTEERGGGGSRGGEMWQR